MKSTLTKLLLTIFYRNKLYIYILKKIVYTKEYSSNFFLSPLKPSQS